MLLLRFFRWKLFSENCCFLRTDTFGSHGSLWQTSGLWRCSLVRLAVRRQPQTTSLHWIRRTTSGKLLIGARSCAPKTAQSQIERSAEIEREPEHHSSNCVILAVSVLARHVTRNDIFSSLSPKQQAELLNLINIALLRLRAGHIFCGKMRALWRDDLLRWLNITHNGESQFERRRSRAFPVWIRGTLIHPNGRAG